MSEEKKERKHEPFPMVIKPIRPTTLRFNSEEELQHFLKEARNPTDTPELQRLRELLRQHKASKRGE